MDGNMDCVTVDISSEKFASSMFRKFIQIEIKSYSKKRNVFLK